MKQKLKKDGKGNVSCICFMGIVLLLLAGCGIYMWTQPDRIYSSKERRLLAERPAVTKKSVLSGSFQEDYEVYLKEQFPGRETFRALQAKLTRMIGKKDADGVYFGADDYLLEQYQEQDFDWGYIEKNVKRTARFLKKYPQARVLFVPVKSTVLAQKLPKFAEISGEEHFFELAGQYIPKERRIDVFDVLNSHAQEYIYYRTDHHWTTLGAYYAYQAWADAMGYVPFSIESFAVRDVCDSFWGTTYAKVLTGGRADTISLYERKDGQAFELEYNMGEFRSESFYDKTKLTGDDPYSVFFGGNQALVDIRRAPAKKKAVQGGQEIRTSEPDGAGRTLLIIKDSFGNCFAPFAAGHYERTVIADLRYINIPAGRLLDVYPADDILILYNSAQFMSDKDIGKLK